MAMKQRLGLAAAALCYILCNLSAWGQIGGTGINGSNWSPIAAQNFVAHTLPSGLGWDNTNFPLNITLSDPGGLLPAIGSVGITPQALFDKFSTARSAPGATYYVSALNPTGNDSNACVTTSLQCLSIQHAITLCNAAAPAAGCTINVNGTNIYYRSFGFVGVVPTVDIAFVCSNGRCNVGTFDALTTTSDGTCATGGSYNIASGGSPDRFVDMINTDSWGNYKALANVASTTLECSTPNSWYYNGTTSFIHRVDGAQPTSYNTRRYDGSVTNFKSTNDVSLYFGGADASSGFDVEGADSAGVFDITPSTFSATLRAVVFSNSSANYGGGVVNTGAGGFAINGVHGIVAFFNSTSNASANNGFGVHNTTNTATSAGSFVIGTVYTIATVGTTNFTLIGAISNTAGVVFTATGVGSGSGTANAQISPELDFLTVNCTCTFDGLAPNQSDNCWTPHDGNVVGIDVAGRYSYGHGGTLASSDPGGGLFVGTYIGNDLGDIIFSTASPPTGNPPRAFYWGGGGQVVNLYLDQVKLDMPPNGYSIYIDTGVTAYLRNPWPTRGLIGGNGTISNY